MGFVIDKLALGLVFLRVIRFSPVSVILPMLHTHLLFCHKRRITLAVYIVVK